jgi:hypothetical protein
MLTSPSLRTERISEYKLNYLPFQILNSNHIPACTSAASVLQLCSTYTFTKRGGHVPCKRNSSYTAYWSFVKRYIVVVHYLRMCMKEYGRCPKFGRGDNSTCSPQGLQQSGIG